MYVKGKMMNKNKKKIDTILLLGKIIIMVFGILFMCPFILLGGLFSLLKTGFMAGYEGVQNYMEDCALRHQQ